MFLIINNNRERAQKSLHNPNNQQSFDNEIESLNACKTEALLRKFTTCHQRNQHTGVRCSSVRVTIPTRFQPRVVIGISTPRLTARLNLCMVHSLGLSSVSLRPSSVFTKLRPCCWKQAAPGGDLALYRIVRSSSLSLYDVFPFFSVVYIRGRPIQAL